MSAFTPYLAQAVSGAPLPAADMRAAIEVILSGDAGDVEIGGFLAALRARGETVEEIAAAAEVMCEKALRVEAPEGAIDTCGTGGDGAGTFNISTAAALVAAGAGVPVAKHGNRAASSKSGSSDVLSALGVKLDPEPAVIARCMREAGVGFMFAAVHHKAAGHAAAARKALGVRTLFNLLGPLSNPAGAKRRLIGVYGREMIEPIARVLPRLGVESAWVAHGSDGLDELTTTGPTYVAALRNGDVRRFEVTPEDAGLDRAAPEDLRGGAPDENAEAIKSLLAGAPGPFRDIVVLNAAAALMVAGKADTLADAARLAERAIDAGAAKQALDRLVEISNA